MSHFITSYSHQSQSSSRMFTSFLVDVGEESNQTCINHHIRIAHRQRVVVAVWGERDSLGADDVAVEAETRWHSMPKSEVHCFVLCGVECGDAEGLRVVAVGGFDGCVPSTCEGGTIRGGENFSVGGVDAESVARL